MQKIFPVNEKTSRSVKRAKKTFALNGSRTHARSRRCELLYKLNYNGRHKTIFDELPSDEFSFNSESVKDITSSKVMDYWFLAVLHFFLAENQLYITIF